MSSSNERFGVYIIKAMRFLFNRVRNYYYSRVFNTCDLIIGRYPILIGSKGLHISSNVRIGDFAWFESIGLGEIIISKNVSISQSVHIASCYKVVIEEGVLIGSNVHITDHNHGFGIEEEKILDPKNRKLVVKGMTIIGKKVWIADNVRILSGVSIGDGAVIGANAVVTKSVPPYTVVAGVPAREIKRY
ncbi:TPA: acyltransferase [Aeromonas hydrophila]